MTRESDRCPGAFDLHEAADGLLARIRLVGGRLTPDQLDGLAKLADELELTSRGNLQIRQVADPAALQAALTALGLLPSASHERVRNILASPLSAAAQAMAATFDIALQATPELASLPARILFGFDDGTGDITALEPDFGLHGRFLVLAGQITSVEAKDLIPYAKKFLEVRTDEWRLADVPGGVEQLVGPVDLSRPAHTRRPIGWIPQADGRVTLAGGLKFGVLPSRLAQFIAAIGVPVIITPWRSIVIANLDEGVADTVLRVLAPMGMIFDDTSPWLTVTACVGAPRCAKGHADVRADASDAITDGTLPVVGPQHWSGCDRRCGKPKGSVDVVATGEGYR